MFDRFRRRSNLRMSNPAKDAARTGSTRVRAADRTDEEHLRTWVGERHLRGELRADEATKSTPFIMVTAESKTENVVAAKGAGVNNYIIKPFNLNVLKSKISAVLGPLA